MFVIDKRILNFLVIIVLSIITFLWTYFIFHIPFDIYVVLSVILIRIISSIVLYQDYSLSWSKISPKTFLIKSVVYIAAFLVYMPIFYTKITISFMASELFLYLFSINFMMYVYYYIVNKSNIEKTKSLVIYGAGQAGNQLMSELNNSKYKVEYFIDDEKSLQNRSIDNIKVISTEIFKEKLSDKKLDLLVIAMPSANKDRVKEIYDDLNIFLKR